MENKRNHDIHVRVSDAELAKIQEKCALAESKSISEYIRSAALRCNIFVAPAEEWQAVLQTEKSAADGINQLATRYNRTGKIYEEDIRDAKKFSAIVCEQLEKLEKMIAEPQCDIYVAPQEKWKKIWKAASKTTINLEQICFRYQVIEKKQSEAISEIKDFSSRISRLCVDIIILLAVRK